MDKAKLGCVARSMQFDHGSTTAFLNLHFWHCAVSAQCMLLSTPVISKLRTTHRPDGMTARGGLGAGDWARGIHCFIPVKAEVNEETYLTS